MKAIPIERVKKDNSNITYYSRDLWKALRKERFRPLRKEQYDSFFSYCMTLRQVECDPYEDLDFQMDLEKFKDTISDREAECLDYFLDHMKQEDIAQVIGISQTLVSRILGNVFLKFSAYYCENLEEDVGIVSFKKHLCKSELECFDRYLAGLTSTEIAEELGIPRAQISSRLSTIFDKFYLFFGVKLND